MIPIPSIALFAMLYAEPEPTQPPAHTVPSQRAEPPPVTPPSDIVLPIINPQPVPEPDPTPPIQPLAPVKLSADVFYIIASEQPFLVFASPAENVKITHESGPVKIRGKFVEAPDKVQTREFKSKYLVSVEAAKTGPCEVLICPVGAADEKLIVRRLLDIAMQPIPPPTPPPTPVPPGPTPTPVPVPTSTLRVLFVYESSATLTKAQATVLNSTAIREYCATHCVKGDDGKTPDVRWFDKDADVSNANATIKAMWAAAKPMFKDLPIVVIFDGLKGTAHPLPATEADALKLLKQFGGP